jgi:hypothetical protein
MLSSVLCFLTGVGLYRVAPSRADREVVMGAIAAKETGPTANRGWEMRDIAAKEIKPKINPLSPSVADKVNLVRTKGVAAKRPGL